MNAHIKADTFASVIKAFLASDKFLSLAPSTQESYGHALRLAEHPDILGAVSVNRASENPIRPSLVQGFLDGVAKSGPGAQDKARTAIKTLEKWALVRDLLPFPITTGTETIGGMGGFRPWSASQVEIGERYAAPNIAKAIVLAGSTGQRGSDLVRMGPTDLEEIEGRLGIHVTQRKTGVQLWIPLSNQFAAILATWERRPGPFLRNTEGLPFTRPHLSRAWHREREGNPALAPLRGDPNAQKKTDRRGLALHGLRATACVRLKRLGATTLQIADMVGMSEATVIRYCRLSSQRDNAMAAVHYLDGTNRERTEITTVQQKS